MIKISSSPSPTYNTMTQRNEKNLVESRKVFYERAQGKMDLVRMGDIAGRVWCGNTAFTLRLIFPAKKVVPLVILSFSSVYWAYGLLHYFNNQHA